MNRFIDELRDLRNWIGQRNGRLLSVALKGLSEGLSPDDVAAAFAEEDTGSPPLTNAEITRAISRAKERISGEVHTTGVQFAAAMRRMKKIQEAASPDERNFVRNMIAIGGCDLPAMPPEGNREIANLSACRLWDSSPLKVKTSKDKRIIKTPRRMALAFLRAIFPDDSKYIFSTWNIRLPREKRFTRHPSELAAHLAGPKTHNREEVRRANNLFQNYIRHFSPLEYIDFDDVNKAGDPDKIDVCPSHIGVNYYTGEATKTDKGTESYANKNTVASFAHLLVEFDMLTLDEQVRFWNGVIMSKSLPILSLVFSGHKSIHGIVKVREHTAADDLFGETSREAKLQMWDRQVRGMWRLCCSDEDPRFRCDAACKDCSRMTRFPGGINMSTCNRQILLWCINPERA